MIRGTYLAAALLCLLVLESPQALAEQSLKVSALTPTVEVAPRSQGRRTINLPTLEYAFNIDAECGSDSSSRSVFVNVADTGKSIADGDSEEDASTTIQVRVPANQIAPVIVENFCVGDADVTESETVELTIESVLSAHSSLLCASETGEQTSYTSTPLDVKLICRSPEQAVSGVDDE